MGWLPWSSSEQEGGVKKTSGGAFESPSRTNRAKCYEARDAFFECLDRNKILDSVNSKAGVTASRVACGPEDQVFEKNCAHSWVCKTNLSSFGESLGIKNSI
jgi:cytochrome c oxidase assembly factor 6